MRTSTCDNVLNAVGGIDLMRAVYYAFTWWSQKLETEVGTGPHPFYMSARPVENAWVRSAVVRTGASRSCRIQWPSGAVLVTCA